MPVLKPVRAGGVLGLGMLLALARGAWGAQEETLGLPLGTVPPAVTIEDLDGAPVDLSRYIGKRPVLLEFWATWCPLCEALLPRLEAAHKRYGGQVDFLVVAVAVNQSKNSIRRHQQRHPYPFPILWDTNGNATRAFQAPSTSFIVVLDARGKVAYTGLGSDQDVERAVAKVVDAGSER